jgi:hemerythrin-like domain-containing protein
MEEHRVIERVLSCLERMAELSEQGQPIDAEAANQAFDFIRTFADNCHHAKEEDLLFPLMEQKGFSRVHGPTGVMLLEHEQGRQLVRAMSDAVTKYSDGAAYAAREFATAARAFVALLRQHIQKEDHCLFSMADQAFTPSEQQSLEQSFERVQREKIGLDTHYKYVSVANQLAERFGVAKVAPAASSACGCSHHE